MTILTYSTDLKIASGWDNAAGYALITDEVDSDSIPFLLPDPFSGLSEGLRQPLLSRRVGLIDGKLRTWLFQLMTIKQLSYLKTTYYDANTSKVTVRTTTYQGTYENYNAYIVIPFTPPPMFETRNGVGTVTPGNYKSNWMGNVPITFNIIGTAS